MYFGIDAETGHERWATKTVHGSRRHTSARLAEFVEEAGYARLRGRHRRRSARSVDS
jgi:hypothetical protein